MVRCWTPGCKNTAREGRNYCHACRTKKYRNKYPLRYAYSALKNNAKRRGKQFTLTYAQFAKFCKDTGYIEKKGTSSYCLSVDRIDSEKGYSIDNIRAITVSENSKRVHQQEYEQPPF